MFGRSLTKSIPSEKERNELLKHLEENIPAPIAEVLAGTAPGTVQMLIDLGDNELQALNYSLALGDITPEEFEQDLLNNPTIMWGIRAREATTKTIRQAYNNVNKSIAEGNITSSKWFIARNVMTAKDQALIDLLKARALNERLSILARIREHSEEAYRAALREMNIEPDTSAHTIKELNAELRKEERKVINEPPPD